MAVEESAEMIPADSKVNDVFTSFSLCSFHYSLIHIITVSAFAEIEKTE